MASGGTPQSPIHKPSNKWGKLKDPKKTPPVIPYNSKHVHRCDINVGVPVRV